MIATASARDAKIQAALAAREAIRRACERSLYEFVRRFWHVIEPGTEFKDGRHIRVICEHLEAMTLGSARSPTSVPWKHLVINMPPRHMKSLLVSVFWPAWVWSWAPHTRWITASYAASLATRDLRKMRSILQSRLFNLLWPGRVVLRKNTDDRLETTAGGHRIATSPEGIGTGEGGDFVLVDDAIKPRDATSPAKRRASIEWWDGSMSSRGNDPNTAVFVVNGQRVHDEDLPGYCIREKGYAALILAAEYELEDRSTTGLFEDWRTEPGELLWPERFSREALEELKIGMGSYVASAQLQQRPVPKGGGIVKRSWWKFWRPEGLPTFEEVIASWDMTFKAGVSTDFVVGQLWGRVGARYYLLAQVRGRWGFVETCQRLTQFRLDHPEHLLTLVEAKANGDAVMDALKPYVSALVPVEPDGSKIARAQAVSPMIEAGNVYIPDPSLEPWVEDFLLEWEHFPLGTNDDQVDACTQALRRFSLPQHTPLIPSRSLVRGDLDPAMLGLTGPGVQIRR